MTDERVEPTKEWLDALIDRLNMTGQFQRGAQGLRDAILSDTSQTTKEH